MPKKKRIKSTYLVQVGRVRHEVAARPFRLWLAAGLIALADAQNRHVAAVTERATAIWERGERNEGVLHVVPVEPPGVSLMTNAKIVDGKYIFAHKGRVRVSRDDQRQFVIWRASLGLEAAERLIAAYTQSKREWDMREQYGWGI